METSIQVLTLDGQKSAECKVVVAFKTTDQTQRPSSGSSGGSSSGGGGGSSRSVIGSAMSPNFDSAGTWIQDSTGWWYQNEDGTYVKSEWSWIDGRCYYFNEDGYCLQNTQTPDGYSVDGQGAWIEGGVVQMQQEVQAQMQQEVQAQMQEQVEAPQQEPTGVQEQSQDSGANKTDWQCTSHSSRSIFHFIPLMRGEYI